MLIWRVNFYNFQRATECTCGKMAFTFDLKKFRQINYLVICLGKQLLSRNFCQKCARGNFHSAVWFRYIFWFPSIWWISAKFFHCIWRNFPFESEWPIIENFNENNIFIICNLVCLLYLVSGNFSKIEFTKLAQKTWNSLLTQKIPL